MRIRLCQAPAVISLTAPAAVRNIDRKRERKTEMDTYPGILDLLTLLLIFCIHHFCSSGVAACRTSSLAGWASLLTIKETTLTCQQLINHWLVNLFPPAHGSYTTLRWESKIFSFSKEKACILPWKPNNVEYASFQWDFRAEHRCRFWVRK